MPRPLTELRSEHPAPLDVGRDLGVTRRTSRSFAAAVAFLVLATLVVSRSEGALTSESASAGSAIDSGVIELNDDDGGRSLFALEDLTPARPAVRCIEITYDGTILPVDLRVRSEAQGSLAEFLDVTIEAGAGGGYGSCDGFVASDVVYRGPLGDLTGRDWVDVGTVVNTGDRRTFRVALQVADRREALGQTTSLEFVWEATPA